jgi:hypothetical protein
MNLRKKEKLIKHSSYNKRDPIHQRIPAHDTTITVGDFTGKIGTEEESFETNIRKGILKKV